MIDKVLLVGIVKDTPQMRQIRPGSFYHTFEVGVDRRWKNAKTGKGKRETDWIPVVVWNRDWIPQAARKGDKVTVDGRIQRRDVIDKVSGKTYPICEVLAEFVENVEIWEPPQEKNGFGAGGDEETDHYGDPINVPRIPIPGAMED